MSDFYPSQNRAASENNEGIFVGFAVEQGGGMALLERTETNEDLASVEVGEDQPSGAEVIPTSPLAPDIDPLETSPSTQITRLEPLLVIEENGQLFTKDANGEKQPIEDTLTGRWRDAYLEMVAKNETAYRDRYEEEDQDGKEAWFQLNLSESENGQKILNRMWELKEPPKEDGSYSSEVRKRLDDDGYDIWDKDANNGKGDWVDYASKLSGALLEAYNKMLANGLDSFEEPLPSEDTDEEEAFIIYQFADNKVTSRLDKRKKELKKPEELTEDYGGDGQDADGFVESSIDAGPVYADLHAQTQEGNGAVGLPEAKSDMAANKPNAEVVVVAPSSPDSSTHDLAQTEPAKAPIITPATPKPTDTNQPTLTIQATPEKTADYQSNLHAAEQPKNDTAGASTIDNVIRTTTTGVEPRLAEVDQPAPAPKSPTTNLASPESAATITVPTTPAQPAETPPTAQTLIELAPATDAFISPQGEGSGGDLSHPTSAEPAAKSGTEPTTRPLTEAASNPTRETTIAPATPGTPDSGGGLSAQSETATDAAVDTGADYKTTDTSQISGTAPAVAPSIVAPATAPVATRAPEVSVPDVSTPDATLNVNVSEAPIQSADTPIAQITPAPTVKPAAAPAQSIESPATEHTTPAESFATETRQAATTETPRTIADSTPDHAPLAIAEHQTISLRPAAARTETLANFTDATQPASAVIDAPATDQRQRQPARTAQHMTVGAVPTNTESHQPTAPAATDTPSAPIAESAPTSSEPVVNYQAPILSEPTEALMVNEPDPAAVQPEIRLNYALNSPPTPIQVELPVEAPAPTLAQPEAVTSWLTDFGAPPIIDHSPTATATPAAPAPTQHPAFEHFSFTPSAGPATNLTPDPETDDDPNISITFDAPVATTNRARRRTTSTAGARV